MGPGANKSHRGLHIYTLSLLLPSESKQIPHLIRFRFQLNTLGPLGYKAVPMAAEDTLYEYLQRLPSMMESFDEALSQLCKDNSSEAAFELRKNLMEYYHGLHKGLQSRYETLKIEEKKPEEPGTRGKNKENKTPKVNGSNPVSSSVPLVLSSVEVRPEIQTLCDKADGHGLRNYIVVNFREVDTFRNELPVAFSKAPDAAKLVMKALEGYDFSESGAILGVKRKPPHSPNRKACILLLESLFPIFGNNDSGDVPSDVKDSAREIAKFWKKEMKLDEDVQSASGLDVQAFLQLLASFRIAADYDKDELCEKVFAILSRRQAPELCRSLGLSPKVPDFIDKLSKSGKRLDALRFAHEFGMMDKIDSLGLLKSYVREMEKDGKELLTTGDGSAASQNDSNSKVVYAMKTAVDIAKKYGLQSQFFKDKLQKKQRELDREKKKKKNTRKESAIYAQERRKRKKEEMEKYPTKEERKKAAKERAKEKKRAQQKRRQSFEPSYGLSERENYASKRAKHASPNETTRVAGGMGNSKAPPYNIDGVQNKSGIVGHDHHTSAFSAANRSSTGLAAGAFASAPSFAAQINDERRRHEGYPSAFENSNRAPVGSSLYSSGVPAGAFAVPLSNVPEVNYGARGHTMNFGEVDRNHVRASVYGTGDLAKSPATQSNYNFEGRSQQSYKLNFGEIDNNSVRASAYGTGVLANSSVTQSHYETRGTELYTSAFRGGNTGSIGSSLYGSNSRTIPSSEVNQGSHERSLGQYSGFAGRNIVPVESSGYGYGVSTVPLSNATQGHAERRGSVIDRYKGSTVG